MKAQTLYPRGFFPLGSARDRVSKLSFATRLLPTALKWTVFRPVSACPSPRLRSDRGGPPILSAAIQLRANKCSQSC